jgi:hypothetical protein
VRLLERDNRGVGLRALRAEGAVHDQVIAFGNIQVGLQLSHASTGRIADVQDRAGVEIYRRERFGLSGERRMLGRWARAGAGRDSHRGQCQTSHRNGGYGAEFSCFHGC